MNKSFRLTTTAMAVAILVTSQVSEARKPSRTPQQRTATVAAQAEASVCASTGYTVGFFNGVLNTPLQAMASREYLRQAYGTVAANGEDIEYEVFYNYTAGFEDFVETFDQRLKEQDAVLRDRFELFWEALNGKGTFLDSITALLVTFDSLARSFQDYVRTTLVNVVLKQLNITPPTLTTYAEHKTRVDALTLEGRKLLFYAHSQGNLFANAAYDYAVGKIGGQSVKLVHVAPASPTLRGNYTLVDEDLVINGLRLVGSVPANNIDIPIFLDRPPGVNGLKDVKGHGLLEIYLNTALGAAAQIKTHVLGAISSLIAPAGQAQDGFFTATLTWNGTGDVDLHTYEPGNQHVYYQTPQGFSGFLDVDNTDADGPEHYFATCDPVKLQTGTYRIGVNNYSGAQGRTAVLQISSAGNGVLGTRSITLGAEEGSSGDDNPSILINVVVTKDPATGKYSATIS